MKTTTPPDFSAIKSTRAEAARAARAARLRLGNARPSCAQSALDRNVKFPALNHLRRNAQKAETFYPWGQTL